MKCAVLKYPLEIALLGRGDLAVGSPQWSPGTKPDPEADDLQIIPQ